MSHYLPDPLRSETNLKEELDSVNYTTKNKVKRAMSFDIRKLAKISDILFMKKEVNTIWPLKTLRSNLFKLTNLVSHEVVQKK